MAMSAVYRANEELLAQLDPQRDLRLENEQLRRELNEALREIMRLNQVIAQLEDENHSLRSRYGRRQDCGGELMSDLEELRAEGESLRMNVIRLLRNK